METQKDSEIKFRNYVNSHQNADNVKVTPLDLCGKFRTVINSNLFFIPSQVVGIEEVRENATPYKLKQKDHDKLVELAKTDYYFNIFEEFLNQIDYSNNS